MNEWEKVGESGECDLVATLTHLVASVTTCA